MGKNKRVNNRYSTSYKRKNIFENFPVVRANGTHLTGTDARRAFYVSDQTIYRFFLIKQLFYGY
jgi:hypothetical protein